MASKRFDKDSGEWNLFCDFWAICQKYWVPEDTDEYSKAVNEELEKFIKRYKATDEIFTKNIALAVIKTLEEKLKK